MAKIKLGARPADFKRTVKFDLLDGSKASIDVVFKYRTRKEYAELADMMFGKARDIAMPTTEVGLTAEAEKSNTAFALEILSGWEFEEPINESSLGTLGDVYPAALQALVVDYRRAIYEGRLGN